MPREMITDDKGDWTCVCGNTADQDGFYPSDTRGNEVEPTIKGPWDGKHYVCAA